MDSQTAQDIPGKQDPCMPPGTQSSPRSMHGIPIINPISPHCENVRRYENHILHKQIGRSKIHSPVCRSGQSVELKYQQPHYSADNLPRTHNSLANSLSRHFGTDHKWELHSSLVKQLLCSMLNSYLGSVCLSDKQEVEHILFQGSSILLLPCSDCLNYAFPPIPLLPRLLWNM